jgi:hypothetical protein
MSNDDDALSTARSIAQLEHGMVVPLNQAGSVGGSEGNGNQSTAAATVPCRRSCAPVPQKRRRANNSRPQPAANWMAAATPVDPLPPLLQSAGLLLSIMISSVKGSYNKMFPTRRSWRKISNVPTCTLVF